MAGGASEATTRLSGAAHLMLSIKFLFKGQKALIMLSIVPTSILTDALQEQEALRRLRPEQVEAPPGSIKTKHTLGSTLLTLGIIVAVIGLLLVPLLSS